MIIIPARLNSTRFPKKILAPIGGIPMVIKTAMRVQSIDDVAIATDSNEVLQIAKEYNIKAVMTSENHQSGTDRINEASNLLGLGENEVIVNVQADEPFIEPEIIMSVKELITSDEWSMASCYKSISNDDANDANLVKVVLDCDNFALYFSRSKIPYDRDGTGCEYFGHLGIYAFNKKSLNHFCSLLPSALENIEKLEQLRVLSDGKKIKMIHVDTKSFGIDTQQDYEKALKLIGE